MSKVFERVTEKIRIVVTEKQKQAILKIKWECKRQYEKFIGIDINQAVIDEGIETFEDFKTWCNNNKQPAFSMWEPSHPPRK